MSRRLHLSSIVVATVMLAACERSSAPTNRDVDVAAPVRAGAVCANNSSCTGPNEFCKKPAGTCTTPGTLGVCTVRAAECSYVNDPVCGCDGKTYSNDQCIEHFGVNIRAKGECPPPEPQGVSMQSIQIVPEIDASGVRGFCRLADRPGGKDLIVRLRNPAPLDKPPLNMTVGFTENTTVQATSPAIPGQSTIDVRVPVPNSCLTGDCRFVIKVLDPSGGVQAVGNCIT